MSPSKVSTITFDKFYNIVDGQQRGASSVHNGINLVTGEKLWDVPVAGSKDVDDAVAAAQKAFKSWSKVPLEQRKERIQKFSELYAGYEEEMTNLLAAESGKPVSSLLRLVLTRNPDEDRRGMIANIMGCLEAICEDGGRQRKILVCSSR